MTSGRRVVVVGGGIAGLTAAYELDKTGDSVVLLESTDRVGGKLRSGEVGSVPVDLGAESVLARRPEAIDLMDEIGLDYEPVRTSAAGLWSYGAWHDMPRTVMGVPGDVDALVASGVVKDVQPAGPSPLPEADVSVGAFIEERFGREVVDRLVEPLLGGVYAGHADRLSLRAAAPQILALGDDPLEAAARALGVPANPAPVFVAPSGGVGRLPEAIVTAGGFEVRTNTTVRAIDHADGHWQLTTGPTSQVEVMEADAVVVAVPAPAAGRLLAQVAPSAAFALAGVDYASIAIATFVFDDAELPDRSGVLIPPVEGLTIKAATCSTNKWNWSRHAAGGRTVVRASLGRAGESVLLHGDDSALLATALDDLRTVYGEQIGQPVASHLQRWGGGLPQYDVGHLDMVATVEHDIAGVPGLEVCGAAYRGVGIPAVIASARAAAARLTPSSETPDDGATS